MLSKLNKFPFGLVTLMEIGLVNFDCCLAMYGEGGGVIFFLSSFGGVKLLFPSELSIIFLLFQKLRKLKTEKLPRHSQTDARQFGSFFQNAEIMKTD